MKDSEKLVDIAAARTAIREGKTILYPTDTIWGIGCDATNEKAIERIKKIKKRSKYKSFIILMDGIPMLERYVKTIPDVCYDLIDYSEKPLTIIYDNPIFLPDNLLAEDGSIGIRITKDRNCMQLIQSIRKPIVSTSANISGHSSPTCFEEIEEEVKEKVDVILNARLNDVCTNPSSIMKISNNGTIKIIR